MVPFPALGNSPVYFLPAWKLIEVLMHSYSFPTQTLVVFERERERESERERELGKHIERGAI